MNKNFLNCCTCAFREVWGCTGTVVTAAHGCQRLESRACSCVLTWEDDVRSASCICKSLPSVIPKDRTLDGALGAVGQGGLHTSLSSRGIQCGKPSHSSRSLGQVIAHAAVPPTNPSLLARTQSLGSYPYNWLNLWLVQAFDANFSTR